MIYQSSSSSNTSYTSTVGKDLTLSSSSPMSAMSVRISRQFQIAHNMVWTFSLTIIRFLANDCHLLNHHIDRLFLALLNLCMMP